MIAAYSAGQTIAAIAAQYGYSGSTVWKYLDRAGIDLRRVGAKRRRRPAAGEQP